MFVFLLAHLHLGKCNLDFLGLRATFEILQVYYPFLELVLRFYALSLILFPSCCQNFLAIVMKIVSNLFSGSISFLSIYDVKCPLSYAVSCCLVCATSYSGVTVSFFNVLVIEVYCV